MYSVQGGQDLQFMATKRLIVYLYTTAHFICTRTYASTGAGVEGRGGCEYGHFIAINPPPPCIRGLGTWYQQQNSLQNKNDK